MHRKAPILALVLVTPLLLAAEIVDRVVAVVNAHAILLSELDTAARIEALLDHKAMDALTDASRQATFERMIDHELLRAEMENSSVTRTTPQEVAAKVQEVRQQYGPAGGDAAWEATLKSYGVSEAEVESAMADQLDGLRLVDFRLRSSALPEGAQIERYYRTVYEPGMHAKHAKPAPLAEVTGQIREILVQQKMVDLTATWLQTLRAQASIQINIKIPEVAAKP